MAWAAESLYRSQRFVLSIISAGSCAGRNHKQSDCEQ
jgi:hypothetical protein